MKRKIKNFFMRILQLAIWPFVCLYELLVEINNSDDGYYNFEKWKGEKNE